MKSNNYTHLDVAKKIGFNPPFDILAASDELFRKSLCRMTDW